MNAFRRQLLLGSLALAALFVAALWAVGQAGDAARRAEAAAQSHALRAAAVARLRGSGSNAAAPRELGPAIEAALRASGIGLDHHQLTSPLPRRMEGGVAYEETEIVLKDLALRQSLQFVAALGRQVPGLRFGAYHVSAVKGSGDAWSVRLTVSRPSRPDAIASPF